MANAIADDFDKHDINNYTYKDREYNKSDNRRLYEQKMVKIVNVIYVVQLLNFVI